MRLVPLAHESFLGLIGCERLSGLPAARYDMQAEDLVLPDTEVESQEVAEFVSVFLSPHQHLTTLSKVEISDRRARYDGVIQYGSQLLVVIESKLFVTADSKQAENINPKNLKWQDDRIVHVKWHDLLERWWNLTERAVLGPAETQILTDFFDFAEAHFGKLLPFNDLERCGENEFRRLRRLRTVLENATGLEAQTHNDGVTVKFTSDVRSVQRATLFIDGDSLSLGLWPGELAPQYQRLYGSAESIKGLIDLSEQAGWTISPNFHLGYRFAQPKQRWYPKRHLTGVEYLGQWLKDFHDHRAGGRTLSQIADSEFNDWLLDRNYADEADIEDLATWVEAQSAGVQVHIRPSVEVKRSWTWVDAVAADRDDKLKIEVREAINQVLAALDEPKLAPQPQPAKT